MGETLGELGLAFIKLTKFESEEAVSNAQRVRAADMKGLATAAVKASRFYRELNAQTVKHLVILNICYRILGSHLYCIIANSLALQHFCLMNGKLTSWISNIEPALAKPFICFIETGL